VPECGAAHRPVAFPYAQRQFRVNIVRASLRSPSFWILRGVPLAGVALLAMSLLPADFAAASKALTVHSKPRVTATTRSPWALMPPTTSTPAATVSRAIVSPAAVVLGQHSWLDRAALPEPVAPAIQATVLSIKAQGFATDRIGATAVNVRSDASKSSARLFVLRPDVPVRVGERRGGWVHVYADAGDGWIYRTFLGSSAGATQIASTRSSTVPEQSVEGRILRVTFSTPVRDGPGGQANHIYDLEPGERVRIARSNGNWALIETTTGESGWVRYR